MPRNLSQEVEHRINLNRSQLNREVQQALTEMGGKLRPRAEAEANLRKNFENGFRDKKLAHAFCDDIYQGINRRHGAHANLNDVQNECTRQYRRYMWLDAEKRQDELVARLTAGQINLIGGSHFPKPTGNLDPIGWAISNSGPGEVLVDGSGCAVLHFKLPMAYDGSMAPHLAPGQPVVGTNKVRRISVPFDFAAFKNHLEKPDAEGNSAHMYLDPKCKVTVGVGHKIVDVAAAQDIPFIVIPEGAKTHVDAKTATQKQIAVAYEQVVASRTEIEAQFRKDNPGVEPTGKTAFNKAATAFEKFNIIRDDRGQQVQVRLPVGGDQLLLTGDVEDKHRLLLQSDYGFMNFNTYPVDARFAVMDMVFILGVKGLAVDFPVFSRAAKMRNWALAATQTNRIGVDDKRDQLVADKMLSAAQNEPFFHNPHCMNRRLLDDWFISGFF